MDDTYMSREEQKQRLKSNVIDKEEESGKDEKRRLSPLVLLALLLVLALLGYGAYYYFTSNMTEEYSVLWERRQTGLQETVETFKDMSALQTVSSSTRKTVPSMSIITAQSSGSAAIS